MWILGGGQISRVGSILYVGALGPKMSVFLKDPELPSCQRPSAPLRGPTDGAPTLSLYTSPRVHSELPGWAASSAHSPTELTCSLALHWAAVVTPALLRPPLGPVLGAAQLLVFCVTLLVLYWEDPRHRGNS